VRARSSSLSFSAFNFKITAADGYANRQTGEFQITVTAVSTLARAIQATCYGKGIGAVNHLQPATSV
jgi:hypothetical protein